MLHCPVERSTIAIGVPALTAAGVLNTMRVNSGVSVAGGKALPGTACDAIPDPFGTPPASVRVSPTRPPAQAPDTGPPTSRRSPRTAGVIACPRAWDAPAGAIVRID